jgi:integrase/recombinase XerD
MTHLRQKMIEEMQLRGLSEATQLSYVGGVKRLAEHYGKSPDLITEGELRQYFLYLKNDKRIASSTYTTNLCGIRFFYQYTLKRDWPTLDLVRPARENKLPVVLSRDEVRQILSCIRRSYYRVCLNTIYACGLRLQEGLQLQVGDIDSGRMVLHIQHGKGSKDRYVPLPEPTLQMLRQHWSTHRHAVWLFPASTRTGSILPTASTPMVASGMQRAFHAAVQASGVHKAATVHSLRHAYATHLFEAGVNLRLIQSYLGHSSPRSTAVYAHLTHKVEEAAIDVINQIMADLPW